MQKVLLSVDGYYTVIYAKYQINFIQKLCLKWKLIWIINLIINIMHMKCIIAYFVCVKMFCGRRVCNVLNKIILKSTSFAAETSINYILHMIRIIHWLLYIVYQYINTSLKSSYWQFNLQDNILRCMFIYENWDLWSGFVAYDTVIIISRAFKTGIVRRNISFRVD